MRQIFSANCPFVVIHKLCGRGGVVKCIYVCIFYLVKWEVGQKCPKTIHVVYERPLSDNSTSWNFQKTIHVVYERPLHFGIVVIFDFHILKVNIFYKYYY